MKSANNLNWRITWYSVLIWFLSFVISSFVFVPWFYFVLPISIMLITIYYFKIIDPFKNKRGRKKISERDRIFVFGLAASIFWFLIVTVLNIMQIAGFYYYDFLFYFSDFRNWYLYALILIVPVVYSLVLERASKSRTRRKNKPSLLDFVYPQTPIKT